jgi:hypothetical protein
MSKKRAYRYRQTDANDMAGLSVFFIVASLGAIIRSFLP